MFYWQQFLQVEFCKFPVQYRIPFAMTFCNVQVSELNRSVVEWIERLLLKR